MLTAIVTWARGRLRGVITWSAYWPVVSVSWVTAYRVLAEGQASRDYLGVRVVEAVGAQAAEFPVPVEHHAVAATERDPVVGRPHRHGAPGVGDGEVLDLQEVGGCERCLRAGMDAYLAKPIRPGELYGVIDLVRKGVAVDSSLT